MPQLTDAAKRAERDAIHNYLQTRGPAAAAEVRAALDIGQGRLMRHLYTLRRYGRVDCRPRPGGRPKENEWLATP